MSDETFNLKTSFSECIKHMPKDALALWFVLIDCSSRQIHPLNISEVASMCNLTNATTRAMMDWLAEVRNDKDPLITISGTAVRRTINLAPVWFAGQPNPINISFEKEEKKVEQLEEKIRILERDVVRAEVGESSSIAQYLKGEERDLVLEVEAYYGIALNPLRAFLLGQMIQGYNPTRVKEAFRQKKGTTDPLKSAYWYLKNGAKGKPAAAKEVQHEKVIYRELS